MPIVPSALLNPLKQKAQLKQLSGRWSGDLEAKLPYTVDKYYLEISKW